MYYHLDPGLDTLLGLLVGLNLFKGITRLFTPPKPIREATGTNTFFESIDKGADYLGKLMGHKKEDDSEETSGVFDSVLQGVGSGIGAGVSGAISGHLGKALGPSTNINFPEQRDPVQDARDMIPVYKDMMDELYPGTTPWERLGSGGGGVGSMGGTAIEGSTERSKQNQNRAIQESGLSQALQLKHTELANARNIAKIQAQANVFNKSMEIAGGNTKTAQKMLDLYEKGEISDDDMANERTPSQITARAAKMQAISALRTVRHARDRSSAELALRNLEARTQMLIGGGVGGALSKMVAAAMNWVKGGKPLNAQGFQKLLENIERSMYNLEMNPEVREGPLQEIQ